MATMQEAAEDFLRALGTGSRTAAADTLVNARLAGAAVSDLVEEVIAPAQREVGERWARNEWSVMQEHAATVVAEIALSTIAVGRPGTGRGRLVAACPSGEWHALAVRLMVESLREREWDVIFLGADVPAPQLERFLDEQRPGALLLGISMVGRLPAAFACGQAARRAGVATVLGGAAVDTYPRCAAVTGTHAGAADADELDALLTRIIGEGPLPPPRRELPEARCNRLVRARAQLGTQLAHDLRRAGSACVSPEADDLLSAGVDELVDAVAAAALLDDAGPAHDLVEWLSTALRAREVPPWVIDTAKRLFDAALLRLVPRPTGAPAADAVGTEEWTGRDDDRPAPITLVGLAAVEIDPATGGGRVTHAGEALAELVGMDEGDLTGNDVAEVLGDETWSAMRRQIDLGKDRLEATFTSSTRRPRTVVLHWSLPHRADDDPDPPTLLLAVEEVSRRRQLRSLDLRALHDPVTGLPERAIFLEHLEQALREVSRSGRVVTVVHLEVEDLEVVSGTHGPEAADELLVHVAHRLRDALRTSDLAGHLGAGTFAVLCPGVLDELDVGPLGDRILAAVSGPYVVADRSMAVSVSIGMATGRESYAGAAASLLSRSAEAMRHTRSVGRHSFTILDDAPDSDIRRRQLVAAELRQATGLNQLRLHYQPVVDLTDGHIVGSEALVRWEHPRRGLLPPAEFLQVAEESGSIVELGHWVLAEACTQVAAWRAQTDVPMLLSVNVSARQLGRGEVASFLERCLDQHGLEPQRLRIEVTETALAGSLAAQRELWELDRLGVSVGIDDFGTGYASLNYVRQLPVRFLKIDRTFVSEMMRDPIHHAIVASVTGLAASLGIAVIAEGVETQQQAGALIDLGCTVGQGFLYGRPLTADRLLAALGPR